MMQKQVEIVSLEMLVSNKHPYRKMKELVDFDRIIEKLNLQKADVGAVGYTKRRLVLCLILQFIEDLSDRELERFLAENTSGKWFCEFTLTEKTPDNSLFCKVRKMLGLEKIEIIFKELKSQLKTRGFMTENFTFVDSTALISKMNLWEERDRAIQEGYEKLNNKNIDEVSVDKDAKIGCKNGKLFWYGYKNTSTVDMQSGMISDVNITSANVADADGAIPILPNHGYVFGDKGFVGIIEKILANGAIPQVILRNNMTGKDFARDSIISKKRSPFERVFSKRSKRVRYRGIQKNQASEYLFAIGFNLKRLVVIG